MVNNATNLGFASYEMPINHPPKDGSLIVNPEFGYSILTTFNIKAENWVDTDLPLTYQFFYQK